MLILYPAYAIYGTKMHAIADNRRQKVAGVTGFGSLFPHYIDGIAIYSMFSQTVSLLVLHSEPCYNVMYCIYIYYER